MSPTRVLVWLVVLSSCEPAPPGSWSEVDLPPGFALDTHREVAVRVDGAPGVDLGAAFLSVRSTGGLPLFEGPASHAVAHGIRARVPANVDTLEIVVREHGRADRADLVPVPRDGVTAYTVGGAR